MLIGDSGLVNIQCGNQGKPYLVILSKRGGKDRAFQVLTGLLQGISGGHSLIEIQRSSPASPRKTPSFLNLLLRFIFYFQ